jgi:hypothetical protein
VADLSPLAITSSRNAIALKAGIGEEDIIKLGEAKGKLAEAEGSRHSIVYAGTIFLGATDPNSSERASLIKRLPISSSLANSFALLQKAKDSRFQTFSKSPLKNF